MNFPSSKVSRVGQSPPPVLPKNQTLSIFQINQRIISLCFVSFSLSQMMYNCCIHKLKKEGIFFFKKRQIKKNHRFVVSISYLLESFNNYARFVGHMNIVRSYRRRARNGTHFYTNVKSHRRIFHALYTHKFQVVVWILHHFVDVNTPLSAYEYNERTNSTIESVGTMYNYLYLMARCAVLVIKDKKLPEIARALWNIHVARVYGTGSTSLLFGLYP